MANHASAAKAARQSRRHHLRNQSVKTAVRTYIKAAETAIASGKPEEASAAVLLATRTLDRAASKGVLHANNAARRKSRLIAKLNAVAAAK